MKISHTQHRADGPKPRAVGTILSVCCALGWMTLPAAADRNWTGAVNANWSEPNNWSPMGVPINGDSVAFGYVSDSHRAMVNDVANLKLKAVTFVNRDYQLDGNSLEIDGELFNGNDPSTVTDSHTTTINCPLIFSGPGDVPGWDGPRITMGLVHGDLTETTIYLHLNGPITLNGNLNLFAYASQFNAGGNGHLYVSGVISGTGDVHGYAEEQDGHVSSIEFNGTPGNTFTGTLNVETLGAAQIVLNKSSGVVVSNRIAMKRGDGFDAATANLNLAAQNQIDPNATLMVNGGSQLHLTGNNMTAGYLVLTNLSGDTIPSVIDTGSTTLSLNGGIIAWNDSQSVIPAVEGKLNLNELTNGWLSFDIGGSQYAGLELQATVGGINNGGFTKFGSAALLLEASNTFNGPVFVNEGILDLRNNSALGHPATSTFLRGGSLTLRNVTIPESLAVEYANSLLYTIGNCAWSGPIVLGQDLVVWADNTSLTGPISGSGGINFIYGTATIGGTAGNTFTGTLLAHCDLLQLSKPSGTKAYSGPLLIGDGGLGGPYEVRWLNSDQNVGATLTLYANGIANLNNHNEEFGPVTFNGGEVDTGTGQCAITQPLTVNPSTSTAVINGFLQLPSADARTFAVNDGPAEPDLLVNAVMIGSPTYFVKQGAGTMRLANANTFFATTLLENGTLDIANAGALGNAGSGCVIFNGATLRFSANGTVANNFEAVGAGTGGTNGAIQAAANTSVTLNGSIQLDADTVFNVGPTASLGLRGPINGAGALTKSGPGSLTLSGSTANTYAGPTTVNAGLLYLAKSGGAFAVPGTLVLGPAPASASAVALLLSPNTIGGSSVTVNANSALNLSGRNQTLSQLTLNDGGSVATGAGTLNLTGGATVSVGSLNILGSKVGSSITGNIGLPPNDLPVSFSVGPYNPTFSFTSAPELDVPANIFITAFEDLSLTPTHVAKSGLGRMRLAGNNSYKSTDLSAGTLQVDGSQPASGIRLTGGTLKGIGAIGPVVLASASAAVAPGDSPGILTCSNFDAGGGSGTLKIELNGTTPGSGYSQLNVNGTVDLKGTTLNATLGYSSSVGDQYTILANDGTDAITGNFSGLPEGAQFYIGGQLFQISYGGIGRLGNDVTLTRLVTPVPPVLTIARAGANSVLLLWPTNSAGFNLQSTTNLSTNVWSAVSPAPIVISSNNVVTNAADAGLRLYRLSKP